MEEERLEFFKLDETDRKVLLWLIGRVHCRSIKSWICYIADEYEWKRGISIDTKKLYSEIQQ
jgi:hypothetical protein